MRRVCMVGTSPESRGGIGSFVSGLLSTVDIPGYEINYIVSHRDASAFGKLSVAATAIADYRHLLDSGNVDIVHLQTAFGASFYRAIPFIHLAKKRGYPVVVHIHADEWDRFYADTDQRKQAIIKDTYSICSKVVVLSDEWRQIFESIIPADKIAILENFTSLYEPNSWPNRERRIILFLSRLDPIKGTDILPQICKQVLSTSPDAKFVICGDGPSRHLLENELSTEVTEGRVILPGWVSGKAKVDILRKASVFLLPSYGEGMPMSVLEAMGLGIPVVGTAVGGMPQLVRDGCEGFLLDPGDVDGISDGIVRLIDDDKLYRQCSRSCKDKAQGHSPRAYGVKLAKLYDGLLETLHE